MKSSQNSYFINEESRIFKNQCCSIYDFRDINTKPFYLVKFQINQQSNKIFIDKRKVLENLSKFKQNKRLKTQSQNCMTDEEFKKVQKQRKSPISQEIYSKFIQQKQKEFLKLLSFCLAILFILVLIFNQNEPVQIKGLF